MNNRNRPPALSGNLKIEKPQANAGALSYEAILQACGNDMRLIVAIAQRAAAIVKAHRVNLKGDTTLEPNPEIVQADIMVTHYYRRLNLSALLVCNDLDFLSEIATIEQNITRPLVFFPAHVKLRFALIGATWHN